jgi:hypothetical protein
MNITRAKDYFSRGFGELGWPLVQHTERGRWGTITRWRLAGPRYFARLLWAKVRRRELELWAKELSDAVDAP